MPDTLKDALAEQLENQHQQILDTINAAGDGGKDLAGIVLDALMKEEKARVTPFQKFCGAALLLNEWGVVSFASGELKDALTGFHVAAHQLGKPDCIQTPQGRRQISGTPMTIS
jgi:hypothetical protein